MEPKLTERIIGCAMRMHNALGIGFLEKVYENALVVELQADGLSVEQQQAIKVLYKNVTVGDYIADLIVEGKVLLELKTVAALVDVHSSVCMNYLRASNLPVCLLINFAKPRLEWKRLVGDSYVNQSEPL
jgi:GxxExxY protein